MIPLYSCSSINEHYSHRHPPFLFAYGSITLYRIAFQRTSAPAKDGCDAHIRSTLLWRVRFVLSGFRSLLLTGSQLVSLPSATKMFQFAECLPIPWLKDILGSKPACGSPRLFAACHVLLKSKPGHPLNGVFSLHSCLSLKPICTSTQPHKAEAPYQHYEKFVMHRRVDSA